MNKTKQIFVVGSSRSGTTMMGRILGNHSKIFTFKEIHFLGWIYSAEEMHTNLKNQKAIDLLSELFAIQKDGIFLKENPKQFNTKSEKYLEGKENIKAVEVYELFLKTITEENNQVIACEQTPKNIFYIAEILNAFPDAKFIHIVRDSRDVLLSQKNKWKRRFLGASKIPLREVIRSYMNYHPITSSRFWSLAVSHGNKMEENPRVIKIKFEELLLDPDEKVSELCNFLNIEFEKNMLKVPNIGSSTSSDKKTELKIDSSKMDKWKKGGLSNAEIYLSQIFTKDSMKANGYELRSFVFPPIASLLYLITFPIKAFVALLLNLRRIRGISKVVKQRVIKK